jgi:hypothetical protein
LPTYFAENIDLKGWTGRERGGMERGEEGEGEEGEERWVQNIVCVSIEVLRVTYVVRRSVG